MSKPRDEAGKTPEKRAAKRKRQRESGYEGVKKATGGKGLRHGSGKLHRDEKKGQRRGRR